MPLAAGARLGAYEIVDALGANPLTGRAVIELPEYMKWKPAYFELGGATVDRNQPTRVTLSGLVEEGEPEPSAVSLAAGGAHTCVLLEDGGVQCWGTNGQV